MKKNCSLGYTYNLDLTLFCNLISSKTKNKYLLIETLHGRT